MRVYQFIQHLYCNVLFVVILIAGYEVTSAYHPGQELTLLSVMVIVWAIVETLVEEPGHADRTLPA